MNREQLRFIQIEIEDEFDEDIGHTYLMGARLYYGPESLDPFNDGDSIDLGDWLQHGTLTGKDIEDAYSDRHDHWAAVAAVMGVPLRVSAPAEVPL